MKTADVCRKHGILIKCQHILDPYLMIASESIDMPRRSAFPGRTVGRSELCIMVQRMLAGFTLTALGLTVYNWITSEGIDPYAALILIGAAGLFGASFLPGFNRSSIRP